MNRTTKIHKLANAVRRYRGAGVVDPQGKLHWKNPPEKTKATEVYIWIKKLELPVNETILFIESCKNFDEFNKWLQTL